MIEMIKKSGKGLVDNFFRKNSDISSFNFSSLPRWYRLTWLIGAMMVLIIIYFTMVVIYFALTSRDTPVGCEAIGPLRTDAPPEAWEPGKSYVLENTSEVLKWTASAQYPCGDTTCGPVFPEKRLNLFYFYTPEQKFNANAFRFRNYIEQCPLARVIGELYPEGYTYGAHVDGFAPEYVVNGDLMIYRLLK